MQDPISEAVKTVADNEATESAAQAEAETQVAEAVTRYRELVASAPDIVPEMVRGSTLEEIDASAAEARRAYAEVSRRVAAQHWSDVPVPTGNPARSGSDAYLDTLKPEAKIALALRRNG